MMVPRKARASGIASLVVIASTSVAVMLASVETTLGQTPGSAPPPQGAAGGAAPAGSAQTPDAQKVTETKDLKYELQPPPAEFEPPVFSIGEPVFNWGSVMQGDIVTHSFKIENKGGVPLKIDRVKPACGCTAVDHDKLVAPGQTGVVTLRVDTKNFTGHVRKTAQVYSNASRDAYQLAMEGDIETPLSFEPKMPKIEYVRGTTPQPVEITVKRSGTKQVKVKGVKVEDAKKDVLQVEMQELDGGAGYLIKVLPGKLDESTKYQSAEVQLETETDTKTVNFPIRVTIRVRDRIEANPSTIYFTRKDTDKLHVAGSGPVTRNTVIKTLDTSHNFKIVSAKTQGTAFEVQVETVKEGQEYRLNANLTQPPAGEQKRVEDKIIVTTDDPLVPQLEVRVTASFGMAGQPAASASGLTK